MTTYLQASPITPISSLHYKPQQPHPSTPPRTPSPSSSPSLKPSTPSPILPHISTLEHRYHTGNMSGTIAAGYDQLTPAATPEGVSPTERDDKHLGSRDGDASVRVVVENGEGSGTGIGAMEQHGAGHEAGASSEMGAEHVGLTYTYSSPMEQSGSRERFSPIRMTGFREQQQQQYSPETYGHSHSPNSIHQRQAASPPKQFTPAFYDQHQHQHPHSPQFNHTHAHATPYQVPTAHSRRQYANPTPTLTNHPSSVFTSPFPLSRTHKSSDSLGNGTAINGKGGTSAILGAGFYDSPAYWLSLYFCFNLGLTLFNKIVLVSFPFPYVSTDWSDLNFHRPLFLLMTCGATSLGCHSINN